MLYDAFNWVKAWKVILNFDLDIQVKYKCVKYSPVQDPCRTESVPVMYWKNSHHCYTSMKCVYWSLIFFSFRSTWSASRRQRRNLHEGQKKPGFLREKRERCERKEQKTILMNIKTPPLSSCCTENLSEESGKKVCLEAYNTLRYNLKVSLWF